MRTYYLSGSIKYAESSDASSLATELSTNLSSPSGLFLSNPTVIRLTNGTFLCVYELSTANSTTSNRLLYSATSSDGITFGTGTQLPNSSLDTALGGSTIFQSVPALVQEPSGTGSARRIDATRNQGTCALTILVEPLGARTSLVVYLGEGCPAP